MQRLRFGLLLVAFALLLAACHRQPPPAGQSRFSLPSPCDPTPYDRVQQDDKEYIDDLPR